MTTLSKHYLLDTHGLIWFITDDAQLSSDARLLIESENNHIYVSVASLWEMAIKFSIGKLHLGQSFDALFPSQLVSNNFKLLDVSIAHLKCVCGLPFHHRDPFDRLIAAQALTEKWTIISADAIMDKYSVSRVW